MNQIEFKPVSVFAPISTGNVSVGFDTLGLALAPIDGTLVGDIVHIKPLIPSEEDQFLLTGLYQDKLPSGKQNNIAWHCLKLFNQQLKKQSINPVSVLLTLEKNIPVSSGLGSSSCSVVATLMALNEFYRRPLSKLSLLKLMGEMEGQISGDIHYDNVAPCYLGGLQLMLNDPEKISQSLPIFDDVYWVIAFPDIEVSTKSARAILPQQIDLKTTLKFGQSLAGFIDASYRRDKYQAFSLLKDVIAEPYRKNLLPNFDLAKSALQDLGALAVGISGSGPSIFCACDSLEIAKQSQHWLEKNYLQSEDGFAHICQVDILGSRVIKSLD